MVKDDIVKTGLCRFVPGLFKIFDEILLNAADNKQRDPDTREIRVSVNAKKGEISILNDGRCIPVHFHETEEIWVPELVMGYLRSGSNFDDSIKKVTGGRNGYGAKLTNIFSKWFTVETHDSTRGLKYQQTWTDNMNICQEPVITEEDLPKDMTKVTFKPDLPKFGMKNLSEGEILKLFERRVHDVAACNEGVRVYFNGKALRGVSFEEYIHAHRGPLEQDSLLFKRVNDRWQIGFGVSTSGQFEHVSFCNSIATHKGGTHVNYIADQLVKAIQDRLEKKEYKRQGLTIRPNQIRNHIFVAVNSLIENPAFGSQTKESLSTKSSHWGSSCRIPKPFLAEFLEQSDIVDVIVDHASARQRAELNRRGGTDKSGRQSKVNVPKLHDANWAGGAKSPLCTLILTEGDSAKALALAGIGATSRRDSFGVFPLRGKPLNVREASHTQVMDNEEIKHITTILGLNHDCTYETAPEMGTLRYGQVMIMTDQDHDGSHIKGLLINFFHHFWPSLLKRDDFLEEFVTPIVKARHKTKKRGEEVSFFTIPEYEKWKDSLSPSKLEKYSIKYYKGLGTSTSKEAKEYFSHLDKHWIKFQWTPDTDDLMNLAFSKKMADDRKHWLLEYVDGVYVDHNADWLTYSDFVNKELILFSRQDNIRSIPSVVDGLKPGQRKVLYGCFKRKLASDMKVAQLAGYVSESTAYHHGEASLHSTIINMAHDFVGSNNLPLLVPSGQFGTRLQGGKDAASPRYLYTRLDPVTRLLFPEIDDELLPRIEEEGQVIEPNHYVPIIPLVLVNGALGLGTGWSTHILPYHPIDVTENVLHKIKGEDTFEMMPYFRGYKGAISKHGETSFRSSGVIEKTSAQTLTLSELPVGRWTDKYKEFLNDLVKPKYGSSYLRSYQEYHSDKDVKFILKLAPLKMELAESIGLHKFFKLEKHLSANNMHLFQPDGTIRKYSSPLEIIDEHFPIREALYITRKAFLEERLSSELRRLSNRMRFLTEVTSGNFVIANRPRKEIEDNLKEENFMELHSTEKSTGKPSFDYLLSTPLSHMTREKLEALSKDTTKKDRELKVIQKKDHLHLWEEELLLLRDHLQTIKDFERSIE